MGAREVWEQPGAPQPRTWAGVWLSLVVWGAGSPLLDAPFAEGPDRP